VTADLLERWLEAVLDTPGATGLGSVEDARRVLLDDAVRAASLVDSIPGRIVDVGSGGGSPGIPLAVALPARSFTLLEAERRKCGHLERFAAELPNAEVVCGRAEEQPVETFGVALAKALAKPPVAAELCLPLVATEGAAILWLGPSADREALARAAERVGGQLESESAGLAVVRKVGPTPSGFPRRTGMARKRPLGQEG
jgi:16S rRNA (guanine527-N7)-methyltransferase